MAMIPLPAGDIVVDDGRERFGFQWEPLHGPSFQLEHQFSAFSDGSAHPRHLVRCSGMSGGKGVDRKWSAGAKPTLLTRSGQALRQRLYDRIVLLRQVAANFKPKLC